MSQVIALGFHSAERSSTQSMQFENHGFAVGILHLKNVGFLSNSHLCVSRSRFSDHSTTIKREGTPYFFSLLFIFSSSRTQSHDLPVGRLQK